MKNRKWTVLVNRKAYKRLPERVLTALESLVDDLRSGPIAADWPNYKKLNKYSYHCHLKKGKPTYVACWTASREDKTIEVYYVGTHEKAPY